MNNFDKAFEITVGIEGGYVNDPEDRGGETKYGISKRSYPWLDIENLTRIQAKAIYYQDFWNTKKMNLDMLPVEIAIKLFDTGVNMGTYTARKMLQDALNLLNRNQTRYKELKVDGWIGQATFKALSLTNKKELLRTLSGLKFEIYHGIVIEDPSQKRFFGGWVKRT